MTDFLYTRKDLNESHNSTSTFAPGRIEFLGNHLDYNGGSVLGVAINAGIYATGSLRSDNRIKFRSESFPKGDLEIVCNQIEKQSGDNSWCNYCLGVFLILQQEGLGPKGGFSLTFSSTLPLSVGLSSSAALELATALALLQLANQKIDKTDLVRICRKAENEFVGLPCGILDQGTSAFGLKDHLVWLDCQEETFSTIPLPANTQIWIFNSGIKHDLVDSLYSTRHEECRQAFELISQKFPEVTCLANALENHLHEVILEDSVKKRCLHVISEQERVHKFLEGLKKNSSPKDLGYLLTESHRSSTFQFENSCEELDFLVDQLSLSGEVCGTRLSGGGFGGAVMAWTTDRFQGKDAQGVSDAYQVKFGQSIDWYHFQASNGAG